MQWWQKSNASLMTDTKIDVLEYAKWHKKAANETTPPQTVHPLFSGNELIHFKQPTGCCFYILLLAIELLIAIYTLVSVAHCSCQATNCRSPSIGATWNQFRLTLCFLHFLASCRFDFSAATCRSLYLPLALTFQFPKCIRRGIFSRIH